MDVFSEDSCRRLTDVEALRPAAGIEQAFKRTLERCHCLARLRLMSVGDFMHGLDALLMMLIQSFPAQETRLDSTPRR